MPRRRKTTPATVIIAAFILALAAMLVNDEAPEQGNKDTFTGRVVGISDGDTIRVLHMGKEQKVRLYGIDTPEKRQPYGTAARKFTSEHVFGKTVTIRSTGKDRYGRILGWVIYADERNLNIEILEAGLAWWYRQYAPDDHVLQQAEQRARNAGRGLWRQKNPVAPWEYRKRGRAESRKLPADRHVPKPVGQIADIFNHSRMSMS